MVLMCFVTARVTCAGECNDEQVLFRFDLAVVQTVIISTCKSDFDCSTPFCVSWTLSSPNAAAGHQGVQQVTAFPRLSRRSRPHGRPRAEVECANHLLRQFKEDDMLLTLRDALSNAMSQCQKRLLPQCCVDIDCGACFGVGRRHR